MSGKIIRSFFGLFMVLFSLAVISQPKPGGELLPPHGAGINPATFVMTWFSPGYVLLQENFEGESFPPDGWQSTSTGKGWQQLDTILCNHWKIPAHDGKYALSNDDSATAGNEGNVDLLITPALDLTSHDSLTLMFDSYFDGAYGQSARVEYSTDGGASWVVLEDMTASLVWMKIKIDLSDMSGPSGQNNVKFAFHSCDNGLNGSGWAIDNVEIANSLTEYLPLHYLVFLDNVTIDTTTDLSAFIPTIRYTYGEEHVAGVSACYPEGNSDTISIPFVSKYLFPVYDLHTEYCGKKCIGMGWSGPYRPPDCWPWELQSTFPTPDYYWTEGGCDLYDGIIYIVFESTNEIMKMDIEGNFVGIFNVPGVPPLTDIAHGYYDNTFYGVCGTDIVYVMDFETHTLLGQFTAPVVLHSIAYSTEYECFWGNNISSDITVFDQDHVIKTFPVGNYGNIHSLAYNDFTYEDANLYAFSRDSTGCLLVEYDGWQGIPTGITKDLSGLHPGGLAGGVYIDYNVFQPGCTTIGGTIQNEMVFNYALGEFHFPGWTPQGIWGYYIYKDDIVFDSVEILCDRWLNYVWYPADTLPQDHLFSVSVKYELDIFGMDGQIAFSEKDGPLQTEISYGHELDFEEKWSSASFNFNKWDTIGQRWEINNSLGNPQPSACVRGINGNGPYSYTLLSYPFQPDSFQSCGISLSYDIRVYDNFPSGNQTMQLDLWESGSRTWQKLKEYHNDTVWTGFYNENIDITNKVKDRYFMIRFHASGEDIHDIQFWSLDNIKIKRSCPPPVDVVANYDNGNEEIILNWVSPYPEISQWIHWDDSIQNSMTGLNTGPDTWCDAAIRWDKFSLENLHGAYLEKISFIPSDPETHYILKVWSGDSAKILRAQKAVSDLEIDAWNVIDLDNPVPIDGAKELWVGYSFSAKGLSPLSLDAGPAADSLGNLCRIGNGNWMTLPDIIPGMDGNFNIRAFIYKPEQQTDGYRLFKSVDSNPYLYLADVSSNEYVDTEIILNLMYCYKVQSMCASYPDTISSSFSDESCIIPLNANEIKIDNSIINMYPNPARNIINIQSSECLIKVEIFDGTGRSIMAYKVDSNHIMMDLSAINPGVYIIAARTRSSTYYKKISIYK